jgi:putative salt-induced outer membrane protein YdiY
LKGDIIQMRDETFEFDSDKLEDLSFDWEDIAAIRSSRKYTYVFADRTDLTGAAVVDKDKVVIAVDGEEHTRARADLMSIIPALSRRAKRWDGKASIGFTLRKGNTDQQDFTGQGFLRRQGKLSRARFDYNGSLGVSDGEQTSNNHRGYLKLDIFLSPRFYVTPAALEVFHDALQNIQVRLTPSSGVGYHALKRKKISLDLELGGGFQFTRYSYVDPGEDDQKERGVIVPTLRLESEPLRWLELDALYTAQVSGDNARDTTQHGELTLSIELTKVFDLDVSWIWDHVQSPAPNEDGTIPKKDDLKLTLGIGINF